MQFLLETLHSFFQQSALELTAVGLGLAYLILAIRQNIWCWFCAALSSIIFTWVFFDVSLLMESLLNVYYLCMAIYGYWCWTHGKNTTSELQKPLSISRWKFSQHASALAIIAGLTLVSGTLFQRHTSAAWPYLDSFTTWASVVTTYMVAKKIFENWYYWLVINSVALFLYIDRALYPTALLMSLYLVLVLFGIRSWSQELKRNQIPQTAKA